MKEGGHNPSLKELNKVLFTEAEETQRVREQSPALRLTNLLGRLVENSTDTKMKSAIAFSGMLGVVVLSMIVDGKTALFTSEGLAVLGGALMGDRIPLVSGPIEFLKDKRRVEKIKKKKDADPNKIVALLTRHKDIVELEELELWEQQILKEESALHPDRYRLARNLFKIEDSSLVKEKFMQAQIIAQENRRSPKYILAEVANKAINVGAGVALMLGFANWISFGMNHQSEAGIAGLADDAVVLAVVTYSKVKQKLTSFLSGFNS